ncbi:putative acyl-CoA dehydrogenase IBR3 [Drosera capensis]
MATTTAELLLRRSTGTDHFDLSSLFNYCRSHVAGFPQSANLSDFSARKVLLMSKSLTVPICCSSSSRIFGHRQSNPTFLLEISSGGTKQSYVLRKKPHGKLLQSAHAVEREYEVLRAPGTKTQIPVPKVFCLCTDATVIGSAFYIMEYLEGHIFFGSDTSGRCLCGYMSQGIAPQKKSAIYRETAKTLASLHHVDVDAIGLGSYGRHCNYCRRQVDRWGKQYMVSTGEGKAERDPKMVDLINWLRLHVPHEDASRETTGLVHGDFRSSDWNPGLGIVYSWKSNVRCCLQLLGTGSCSRSFSFLFFSFSASFSVLSLLYLPIWCCLYYTGTHCIVDARLDRVGQDKGLEATSIPPGLPSMAEYLAEYCSAAVIKQIYERQRDDRIEETGTLDEGGKFDPNGTVAKLKR